MPQTYYSILTDTGIAKIANATVLGGKVDITRLAVGDSNGTMYPPSATQTTLKNERWSGVITKCEIDSVSANTINVSAVIPSSVGGFTIREIGIFDANNKLIAIGNCADIQKVAISDGMSAEVEVSMKIIVSNTATINVQVDPTVIIATKADISTHNADPNAHSAHFGDTVIHVTAEDKERWNATDELAVDNRAEIDQLKLGRVSDGSRLTRLEDAIFNDITGNPYLITFPDLTGIVLIKGVWNKSAKRLEV